MAATEPCPRAGVFSRNEDSHSRPRRHAQSSRVFGKSVRCRRRFVIAFPPSLKLAKNLQQILGERPCVVGEAAYASSTGKGPLIMLLSITARHNPLRSFRAWTSGSLAAVHAHARLRLAQQYALGHALATRRKTSSWTRCQSASIRVGARTLLIGRRLAGALVATVKKLRRSGRRAGQLAAARLRMARIAVTLAAASLCRSFARLSADARAFARKSRAALFRRHMLSRWLVLPVYLTRSVRS